MELRFVGVNIRNLVLPPFLLCKNKTLFMLHTVHFTLSHTLNRGVRTYWILRSWFESLKTLEHGKVKYRRWVDDLCVPRSFALLPESYFLCGIVHDTGQNSNPGDIHYASLNKIQILPAVQIFRFQADLCFGIYSSSVPIHQYEKPAGRPSYYLGHRSSEIILICAYHAIVVPASLECPRFIEDRIISQTSLRYQYLRNSNRQKNYVLNMFCIAFCILKCCRSVHMPKIRELWVMTFMPVFTFLYTFVLFYGYLCKN